MLLLVSRPALTSCVRKFFVDIGSTVRGFYSVRSMADNSAAATGPPVVKTEKQLKKEAQKNAKLAKYNEKMAKQKARTNEEVKKQYYRRVSLPNTRSVCVQLATATVSVFARGFV